MFDSLIAGDTQSKTEYPRREVLRNRKETAVRYNEAIKTSRLELT